MKKVISIVTSALLCFGLLGCKGSNKEDETTTAGKNETTTSTVAQKETKVFHEDKGTATYDNFLEDKVGED